MGTKTHFCTLVTDLTIYMGCEKTFIGILVPRAGRIFTGTYKHMQKIICWIDPIKGKYHGLSISGIEKKGLDALNGVI